jgi:hypothetical protein
MSSGRDMVEEQKPGEKSWVGACFSPLTSVPALDNGDDEQAVQGDRRGHLERPHGEDCACALILCSLDARPPTGDRIEC